MKKTILVAALLVLCIVTTTIGGTFAWFTDEVVSANNTIEAGNLDIELYHSDKNSSGDVGTETKLFDDVALWEPGAVAWENLTVSNVGNLALKYQLTMNASNYNNLNGNDLTGALKIGFVDEIAAGATRESVISGVQNWSTFSGFFAEGSLLPDSKKNYGVVVYWQPTAEDNNWNVNNGKTTSDGEDHLHIDLGVKLVATQLMAEEDSFDNTYDEDAWFDAMVIQSAADLKAALVNGGNIVMPKDMTIDSLVTITKPVKLNLNGNKLNANLIVAEGAKLTVADGDIATVSTDASAIESKGDLTLENVNITSQRHAVRIEGGTAVINGGTYKLSEYAGRTQHALNVSDGGHVIVNGGIFIGPKGTASDSGAAVNVQTGSTVIINGGNFSGGKNNTLSANGTLIVKGGTFDQNPSAFVAAGFEVEQDGEAWVVSSNINSSDDLKNAIENAQDGDTISLDKGEYALLTLASKEGVTIEGAADGSTVIVGNTTTGFGGNFGKDTTIKNLTFSGSTNGVRSSYAKGGTTTFDNCVFAGGSTYGFHIDQSEGATFIFNNCTFKGFNAFAGDLEKVIFNDCTFLSNGNYGHTNIWSTAELNNCTFGDNTSISTGSTAEDPHIYFNGVEETYHHEFIGSAKSLFAFAKSVNEGNNPWNGQAVILVDDIDLENKAWTPIGQTGATQFQGIFDGQDHIISNLKIDSSAQTGAHYSSGLFGWLNAATVKNVKVSGANVTGNHNVGVIAGYMETAGCTIYNCHVINSSIVATHANDDACGDKAGIIVGHAGNSGVKVEKCSAAGCTVKAGRDAGQIVGAATEANVINCQAKNVTVSATGDCNGKNINNAIIGRVL